MKKVIAILGVSLALTGCISTSSAQVEKFKEIKKDSAMYCQSEDNVVMQLGNGTTMIKCANGSVYMYDNRSVLDKITDKFLN